MNSHAPVCNGAASGIRRRMFLNPFFSSFCHLCPCPPPPGRHDSTSIAVCINIILIACAVRLLLCLLPDGPDVCSWMQRRPPQPGRLTGPGGPVDDRKRVCWTSGIRFIFYDTVPRTRRRPQQSSRPQNRNRPCNQSRPGSGGSSSVFPRDRKLRAHIISLTEFLVVVVFLSS